MIMGEFNSCRMGNKEKKFQSSHKRISHFQKLKLPFFFFLTNALFYSHETKKMYSVHYVLTYLSQRACRQLDDMCQMKSHYETAVIVYFCCFEVN